MHNIADKVVLVTGGANGIGRAFVTECLRGGASHVIIIDVADATKVVSELNKTYGPNTISAVRCDVANTEEMNEVFKSTIEKYGRIDVFVNNAGIMKEDEDNFLMMLDINFRAVLYNTIKAISYMDGSKGGSRGGCVINISSVAALKPFPLTSMYGATKMGVLHFSMSIGSPEVYAKTGVRVITMCYGLTNTEIMSKFSSLYPGQIQKLQEVIKVLPMQTPESAAKHTIEAFNMGESGSVWISWKDLEAVNYTDTVTKAYKVMTDFENHCGTLLDFA